MLNGLDLFSGYGGISLALGDWVQTVAYCEKERYAQGILLSRMAEGILPPAPIWDDVATLEGKQFRGLVDIIYGGFPCQDISIAGRGRGLEGKRSGLFFEVARLVEEIKPRLVFLENVPAIRTRGLLAVVEKFTKMGYDCRWTCISANHVGAPHKRERWFLLAHANCIGDVSVEGKPSIKGCISEINRPVNNGAGQSGGAGCMEQGQADTGFEEKPSVEDSRYESGRYDKQGTCSSLEQEQSDQTERKQAQSPASRSSEASGVVADSDCENLREQSGRRSRSDRKETSLSGVDGKKRNPPDSGGERLEGFWKRTRRIKKGLSWIGVLCDRSNEWDTIPNWEVEPSLGGKSYGSSGRVDGGGAGDIESVDWEIERASQKVLQYVRQDFVSKEIQRAVGGLDCIQAEETLLSVVREFEIGGRISRPVMEGKETPEELLREMQYCEEAVSASLRPGQVEQFFRECPDTMRELSQLVASRSPTTWNSPLWESSIERVTDVTEDRVDRIKALGNGVVPAQVKKAFEVLMGLRVDDDLEDL